MTRLQDATSRIMSKPTPQALIDLQGVLLTSQPPGSSVDQVLDICDHCYSFLTDLQSKLTAKQYSELASLLDIGAVGLIALESLIAGGEKDFWLSLIMGGVAEGLMVAASRQYIKGWQVEAGLVFTQAVWYLNDALWHMSERMQPDASPQERWQAIQSLLAPARDPEIDSAQKAVLVGLVFQMLLLIHLAPLLAVPE